jgi:acetyltransferase-like isoleucine patch superfamily enzyme
MSSAAPEAVIEAKTAPESAESRRYRPRAISPARRVILAGRNLLLDLRNWYLRKIVKMDISPKCRFSLRAKFDRTNPRGVHIDDGTYVVFGAVILAHDMSRLFHADTFIGKNCFIGANAIIMPGIRIGDQCIVAAGSVVTKDIPSNTMVGGNPAKTIRENIRTQEWGILVEAYEAAVTADERRKQQGEL